MYTALSCIAIADEGSRAETFYSDYPTAMNFNAQRNTTLILLLLYSPQSFTYLCMYTEVLTTSSNLIITWSFSLSNDFHRVDAFSIEKSAPAVG